MRTPYRRKPARPVPSAQEWKAPLDHYSTYELMFELVKRVRLTNGFELAGMRQLVIIGRACVEELARRAYKAKGEYDNE